MDGRQFDSMTRAIARGLSRRGGRRILVAASLGAAVSGLFRSAGGFRARAQDASRTVRAFQVAATLTPTPRAPGGGIRIGTPGPTGVIGASYVDPAYGWTIQWDDSWQVRELRTGVHLSRNEDDPQSGIFVNALDTRTAGPWFTSQDLRDPESCLQFYETWSPRNPAAAVDDTGAPLRGETAESAWAVYTFAAQSPRGQPVDYGWYAECRILAPGESLLQVAIVIPLARFNDEFDDAFAVLDTVSIPPPGTWRPLTTPTPIPQPPPRPTPTPRRVTCDPAGIGGIGWPCDRESDCCERYCCCQLSSVGMSATCNLCDFCA